MYSTKNKLYIFLGTSCLAGYIWLFLNVIHADVNNHSDGVCLIKHVTNIPCPSCGSTRSIISILNGNIVDALYWNPIGLVLLLIMIGIPLLMIYDYLVQKDTLFKLYKKSEKMLQNKIVAIPAILILFLIWIWNIYKGL
jgi:hypothetical protein